MNLIHVHQAKVENNRSRVYAAHLAPQDTGEAVLDRRDRVRSKCGR